MKLFLAILNEKQPHLLDDALLEAHVAHLKKLRESSQLLVCGPCTDNQNAVLVFRANSQAQAETLIKQDPFIIKNYYKSFTIKEFIEADEKNNWLMDADQTRKNLRF